jgi:peptidoglycan-associated lipoprotein
MKTNILIRPAIFVIVISLLCFYDGCSKKEIKVSVLPQAETVKETTAAAIPAVPKPAIDSAAMFEELMRRVLQNIYFDFNKYDLRTDVIDQLAAIGRILREHQGVVIMIEGHCDERGSSEYNMGLGLNRAMAAKKWLVAYGIADSRIETTSYGKERLAVEGCTDDACHQKNRRDELKTVSSAMASFN